MSQNIEPARMLDPPALPRMYPTRIGTAVPQPIDPNANVDDAADPTAAAAGQRLAGRQLESRAALTVGDTGADAVTAPPGGGPVSPALTTGRPFAVDPRTGRPAQVDPPRRRGWFRRGA